MESTPQPAATVEADKEEEVEEEEEVSAPVVFLCIKCHLIVGDSYAFHSTNPDMQTITLSAASNVKRSEELFTSHNGHDIGSTFINFKCSGCNNPLGRYYLTTSSDLDNLREVFTFEVKNVSSYELGKARHGKIPAAPTITDESEGKKRIILESGESLEETLAFMQTEIDKVCIYLHVYMMFILYITLFLFEICACISLTTVIEIDRFFT